MRPQNTILAKSNSIKLNYSFSTRLLLKNERIKMIIYIASYPRSGNSWIQLLIYRNFRRLVSSVYDIGDYPPPHLNYHQIKIRSKDPILWGLRVLLRPKLRKKNLIWNKSIALYREPRLISREIMPVYRFIMPGCLEFLTEENRKRLAAEEEIFFLKTHELPYPKYFEGELVIQPIRNPGAAIWSYYKLMESTRQPGEPHTNLDRAIEGKVLFGSWSDYHKQWTVAASELGDRYLPVSFEWLADNQDECCRKIEKFTGIKYWEREFLTFKKVQQMNPISKREGKAFGWERNYSNEQLHLLYDRHGEMMKKLNYSEPTYHLANLENIQGS